MLSIATYHRTFRNSWNVCLTLQNHILRHGFGYMTSTVIGWNPCPTIHPTRPEAGPLYYASLCGFHGLVERLVSAHSSDVKSRGGSHTTPLHAASVMGHLEVASLLIKNGADPNSRDSLDKVPLHLVSQGRTARHGAVITRDCAAPREFRRRRGCHR
jgi:hypothetical protein